MIIPNILWKKKHVPNHQPAPIITYYYHILGETTSSYTSYDVGYQQSGNNLEV